MGQNHPHTSQSGMRITIVLIAGLALAGTFLLARRSLDSPPDIDEPQLRVTSDDTDSADQGPSRTASPENELSSRRASQAPSPPETNSEEVQSPTTGISPPRQGLPHNWEYREHHIDKYSLQATAAADDRDRYRCFDMLARLSISTLMDDLGMYQEQGEDAPPAGEDEHLLLVNSRVYRIPRGLYPEYDDFRTYWVTWAGDTSAVPDAPLPAHVEEGIIGLADRARDVLARY